MNFESLHEFDESATHLERTWPVLLRGFYEALVQQGFLESQAWELTLELMTALCGTLQSAREA